MTSIPKSLVFGMAALSTLFNLMIMVCAGASSLSTAHDIFLINAIYLSLSISMFMAIHKEHAILLFIHCVLQSVYALHLLSLVSAIIYLIVQLSTHPKLTYNMFIPISNVYDFSETSFNHLRVGLTVALSMAVVTFLVHVVFVSLLGIYSWVCYNTKRCKFLSVAVHAPTMEDGYEESDFL
uniref:Uncharacterized protein n=1 Tax=Steinernema glaseri TaxID=37863 RepID=A0A1I7Y065_9BILA